MRSIGVYIHIPFCVQKCAYCDFLSGPGTRPRQQAYMAALRREIALEAARYTGYEVQTVFIGGGTPSILNADEIAGVLDGLRRDYHISGNVEITMEMNPGTADGDKLFGLKEAGINRLSVGLQSADDAELKLLGRIHTYEDFLRTYRQARDAGFANINIDLMSALPGQDINSWVRTLEKVTALQPEHISAYSLIIEEGTRLHDRLDEYPPVPDEDEDRRMYQMTKQILAEKGYRRYEISNYAKAGYECRHNCIYWQRGIGHTAAYVGFGLGAASMVGNVRWKNTDSMECYILAFEKDIDSRCGNCTDECTMAKGTASVYARKEEHGCAKEDRRADIKEDVQKLSQKDRMEEFMFLGLRMTEGVSALEFADSFGLEINDIYGGALCKWEKEGMLMRSGGRIWLTDAGIDVSNRILADFLL